MLNPCYPTIKPFKGYLPSFEECDFSYIGYIRFLLDKPLKDKHIEYLSDVYSDIFGRHISGEELLMLHKLISKYTKPSIFINKHRNIDMSILIDAELESKSSSVEWKKSTVPFYVHQKHVDCFKDK